MILVIGTQKSSLTLEKSGNLLVKSQTTDDDTTAPFQLKFAKTGGGLLDMNIHDVDLARWFLGSEMEQATSYGGCYKHEGFSDFGDVDNAAALTGFENGSIAFFLARLAPHGHDTHTQILGTDGILRIGHNPRNNHVEILDPTGVRNECVKTFFERFEEAFLLEPRILFIELKKAKVDGRNKRRYDGPKRSDCSYEKP